MIRIRKYECIVGLPDQPGAVGLSAEVGRSDQSAQVIALAILALEGAVRSVGDTVRVNTGLWTLTREMAKIRGVAAP
jgi:hypothetical protein